MAEKHIPIQTGQDYNGRPQFQKKHPNNVQGNRPSTPAQQVAYTQQPKRRAPGKRAKKYWWVPFALLLIAGIVILGKGYLDTKKQLSELSDTNSASQADGEELVKEISKFFTLPEETPTVATVNDATKLQDQEFFKAAETGDKVLIFPEAGRALLYRPSTGKVIEYAKVNLNTSGETPTVEQ